MRIGIFTDDYLPHIHGVATSIRTYRDALEKLGHEVFIVAPKKLGYDDHDDHIIRMPSVKNFVFGNRPTSVLYPGLVKKLDKYQFDVVHSHTQFYLGVLAHGVAKRQGVPHITSIHTLYTEMVDDYPVMITAGLIAMSIGLPLILRTKPILPFTSADEIRNLRSATIKELIHKQGWRLMVEYTNRTDVCISPSIHLRDILLENGLKVPSFVLPNSIDSGIYSQASPTDSPLTKGSHEKFILCVARISLEKRQFALVEAMKHLKTKNVKLILAGDGPEMEPLKNKVQTEGLSDKVVFTGMLSRDEIASLMKQSDICVLASYRFDNQPMTLLEAAASGLPVVYCDDRLTESLTEGNSYLTSGIEGEDFAEAFDMLFADPSRLKKMSSSALEVAKDFDSIVMAEKLSEIYSQAVERNGILTAQH